MGCNRDMRRERGLADRHAHGVDADARDWHAGGRRTSAEHDAERFKRRWRRPPQFLHCPEESSLFQPKRARQRWRSWLL